MTQLQREAVADAVLRIVAARVCPTVDAGAMAKAAGVSVSELRDALERRRAAKWRERRRAQGLGKTPNAYAPPGQRWCSGMPGESGHFVDIALMVRNRNTPSGCSNLCRAHHAEKAAIRKERRRLSRMAS